MRGAKFRVRREDTDAFFAGFPLQHRFFQCESRSLLAGKFEMRRDASFWKENPGPRFGYGHHVFRRLKGGKATAHFLRRQDFVGQSMLFSAAFGPGEHNTIGRSNH